MKRKDFFLFFILPFAGVIIIFFVFSWLNRVYIQKKAAELVQEQLQATSEILKVNITRLLEERYPPEKIIELSGGEEAIYYLALLDHNNTVLSWSSRFEGYLPFSLQDLRRTEPWVISSPAGKIFNLFSPLTLKNGQAYLLYIGYSLKYLEDMLARSNRSYLIVFAFLAAIGIIFFSGVFELQKSYLAKTREAEKEKKEKERFREISAFTAAVAHEIKNPLNSISLLFELLQKKLPQEFRDDILLGKTEVRKVSQVIDRFSDHLKPLTVTKERFSLHDVVISIHESLAKEFARPSLSFCYAENRPIYLYADKNLFSRALTNLLRNAFEATDQGTISVEAQERRRTLFIRISDTGKGIEAEDMEHIFDPFFTTKDRGMGIGLNLARRIIEAHEGTIEVESRVGQGTVFVIRIPGGHHG